MSTIEIKKVTKQFGNFTAVRDADLSVNAGEVVCLLGPSGCGKTTTLRAIAGLEEIDTGENLFVFFMAQSSQVLSLVEIR